MRLGRRKHQAGFGLIEAAVAMAVFAIALVGVMQLQLLSVRSNTFARRATLATSLAVDLTDQIGLWEFDDPRLATDETISSESDPLLAQFSDLGRDLEIPSDRRPHYAELDEGVALENNALELGGRGWGGLRADVENDGEAEIRRYWSVFEIDANADGVAEAKAIVVVSRWFEAGLGQRQVSVTSFRANPQVLAP